jgi:predicted xylose isomerase-like sugar epimerase
VKRTYRACLLLDDSTKYEFEITVHGEGLREPLGFKMSVVKDKLNALVRSDEIARLGGEDVVMDVLKEFKEDGDEGFIDRYW